MYSEAVISWTYKEVSEHLFQIFNSQYCDFKTLKYLWNIFSFPLSIFSASEEFQSFREQYRWKTKVKPT